MLNFHRSAVTLKPPTGDVNSIGYLLRVASLEYEDLEFLFVKTRSRFLSFQERKDFEQKFAKEQGAMREQLQVRSFSVFYF